MPAVAPFVVSGWRLPPPPSEDVGPRLSAPEGGLGPWLSRLSIPFVICSAVRQFGFAPAEGETSPLCPTSAFCPKTSLVTPADFGSL